MGSEIINQLYMLLLNPSVHINSVRTTFVKVYLLQLYCILLVLAVWFCPGQNTCLSMQPCLDRAGRAASQTPLGYRTDPVYAYIITIHDYMSCRNTKKYIENPCNVVKCIRKETEVRLDYRFSWVELSLEEGV